MNAKKNISNKKTKKQKSAKYTFLFFGFVLISCFFLIVLSSVLLKKDGFFLMVFQESQVLSKTSVPQEQTMDQRTSISETISKSSVPQGSKIKKSQNNSQSSVPQSSQSQEINNTLEQNSVPKDLKNQEVAKILQQLESSVPQVENRGNIVLILDDGGHNMSQLEPFLALPFPLTIAVLPALAYSKETAIATRQAGKEVMLHQPMQAINLAIDPGPNAIRPNMSDVEIRSLLQKNVSEIAPIVGMNNHEGSLITADAQLMATVLDFCKENKLYFLDSRTNVETKALLVANEKNMKIWERNIFLDNTPEKKDIVEMFNAGLAIAEKNGLVIMIGHVWSGSHLADILRELGTEAQKKGFVFTTILNLQ